MPPKTLLPDDEEDKSKTPEEQRGDLGVPQAQRDAENAEWEKRLHDSPDAATEADNDEWEKRFHESPDAPDSEQPVRSDNTNAKQQEDYSVRTKLQVPSEGTNLDTSQAQRDTENAEWEKSLGHNDPEEGNDKNPNKPQTAEPGVDSLSQRERAAAEAKSKESSATSKSETPEELKNAETAASSTTTSSEETSEGLYTPEETPEPKPKGSFKNFFWGSGFRKKATLSGGVISLLVGGSIGGLTLIATGPFQAIQASQVLQGPMSLLNLDSSDRLSSLFRYARVVTTADIGETRVGYLGHAVFNSTINQLGDIGITFQRNPFTGIPQSVTIDTSALAKQFPELDGMSPTEKTAWLSNEFSVDASDVSSSGGKFFIDTSDYGIGATRALTGNILASLDNGVTVSAIKLRALSDFFDAPSLFHPIRRLTAAADKKLFANSTISAETEDADEAALVAPTEDQATGAVSDVAREKTIFTNPVTSFFLLTGGVCFVRDVAQDVVTINRYRVAIPSVLEAARVIAVGQQAESGQDISSSELGAVVDGFSNSAGQSIWQGGALEALEGDDPTGTDLPSDDAQAFSGNTTVSSIQDGVDDALGLGSGSLGNKAGSILCSGPGLAAQAAVAIAASFVTAVGSIPSGGSADAAFIALWTAKEGLGFAASALATHFVEGFILNTSTDATLAKDAFSGPIGGDLLAYGAKEMANISATSTGGVALPSSQSTQIDASQAALSEQQFQSEGLFARVFDINDYRSLLGRLADDLSPSFLQNTTNLVADIGHIGSIIPAFFSDIMAHAHAATTSYNWGFPEYGIPPVVMNDPAVANPYANSDYMGTLLDNATANNGESAEANSLIARAQDCFGDQVSNSSGMWDVISDPGTAGAVDPASSSYAQGDCDDDSVTITDPDWASMMMFVFDTKTMEAAACYAGDTQSCQELGYDS